MQDTVYNAIVGDFIPLIRIQPRIVGNVTRDSKSIQIWSNLGTFTIDGYLPARIPKTKGEKRQDKSGQSWKEPDTCWAIIPFWVAQVLQPTL